MLMPKVEFLQLQSFYPTSNFISQIKFKVDEMDGKHSWEPSEMCRVLVRKPDGEATLNA
jgi:hypothetical protein